MFERYSRVKFLKSSPETFIVWDVRGDVAELLSQNNSDMFEALELLDDPFFVRKMNLSSLSLERNCYPYEDLRIACEMMIHARTWHDHIIARRDVFRLFHQAKENHDCLGEWFWDRRYVIGDEISLPLTEFFTRIGFLSREEAEAYDMTIEELIYVINAMTSARDYYRAKIEGLRRAQL